MKPLLSLILALTGASAICADAAVALTRPTATASCPTSFAIVADSVTYARTSAAMLQYRDALQADGLATYILTDNWTSPAAVRTAIKDLYAKTPNLEGIVLVGDVPVAMVRNAQHMTTAFKMDEDNYPFIDSSVPSDRFYDCLDLDFRFIRQDSTETHLFYYELSEDCPQHLNPTFYSARIRYPEARGGDKYEAIATFLRKAARAKSEMAADVVDRVVSFNGHGYNSDCLIAWMDEEKAYRENFPEAFKTATGFKHWNFRMVNPMKDIIKEELARPGIDVFMFHEHGAPDTQYINGFGDANNLPDRLRFFKRGIYSRVKRAIRRGNPRDEVIEAFSKEYNLTPAFFSQLDDPSLDVQDSIEYAAKDIFAPEFHSRVTMPRFVMFDACYNGSFHESENIAGEYIFNPGNTLAAQGNTRNVLQDRWTIEMIGLLSHGVRVGQYNRLVATLEGHLIGDPTVRFKSISSPSLSADLTNRRDDAQYWKSLLESPYADLRSIAVRNLAAIEPSETFAPRLLEIFKTDPFNTTRLEALMMLAKYDNADFRRAVALGISDPYERIARMAADMAGDIGDPALLAAMVPEFIEGNERQRVNYILSNSLTLFPKDSVMAAIDRHYATTNRLNAEAEKEMVKEHLAHAFKYGDDYDRIIPDKSASERRRISAIRFMRNNPRHPSLDLYFATIADPENSDNVRRNMAEALGWFKYSVRKTDILNFCDRLAADPATPAPVAAELRQTARRLRP